MKTLFGQLGLIFFSILAISGVLMVLVFFDLSGIHQNPLLINWSPFNSEDLQAVAALVKRRPTIEWKNPLAGQPSPSLFTTPTGFPQPQIIPPSDPEPGAADSYTPAIIPTLELTPTPIPPMDPVEYRTEVTLRAKAFAAALESFLAANDRLARDDALMKDTAWSSEMRVILAQVVETGRALSEVGPPPAEYSEIHTWLIKVGPEAEGLREHYQYSLDHGDPSGFTDAGKNFNQIKEDLAAALSEMSEVGWPLE